MEKLWGDVQSLVRESFESFQGNFREITHRRDQMEARLTDLQEVVDQHLSDPTATAAGCSESGCTRKRKIKTPVTLQVVLLVFQ